MRRCNPRVLPAKINNYLEERIGAFLSSKFENHYKYYISPLPVLYWYMVEAFVENEVLMAKLGFMAKCNICNDLWQKCVIFGNMWRNEEFLASLSKCCNNGKMRHLW